ncbi:MULTISPECIES: hypothetical protein [unclassified Bradyrhizobium]|uniref:hypothetical protein n=1 Tax=unclassified Bradyrhizobium TaxID=2631580 RepID=UPI0028EA997F|nr:MULTISPECIES: hypothetical protein [unclassified Bradyrhizobium]
MEEPSLVLSLMPFLLTTVIFFVFTIPIARRKGRGLGFAALSLIPFVTPFILLYLVSLTDKAVLDRLAELEAKSQ